MTTPRVEGDGVSERKAFLRIGAEEEATLTALSGFAESQVDQIIEELYTHILSFPETRSFFPDDETLNRVKALQRAYFLGLTGGEYGEAYVEQRRRIGLTHHRIGLVPKWYLGGYCHYLTNTFEKLSGAQGQTLDDLTNAFTALLKIMFLDLGLVFDAYIQANEELITQQSKSILELSTPVISLWEGILVAPLIGTMDTERARQVMERLLDTIVQTQSTVAVLDVTGLPVIDTQVANHLIDIVRAAKMLGASVIITGISPPVAQTLARLQIDLSAVITRSNLRAGLEEAFQIRGLRMVQRQSSTTEDPPR